MQPRSIRLRFKDARHPVRLVGCGEVTDALRKVLRNWPHDEVTPRGGPGGRAAEIGVRREGDDFELRAPWLETPLRHRDPVHMACDVIVHLINSFVRSNPELLCLHAAAVRIDGRLVVFPSSYRSGKSLLGAHLAMAGARVFTDDVLPVAAPSCGTDADAVEGWPGIALGVAPRLRLPIPEDAGDAFEAFVSRHRGPTGERYGYLDLGTDNLASHGETAPISAFVFLDRSGVTAPRFAPAEGQRRLSRLIERNFARELPAGRLLERMEALFVETPCYTLAYARAETGVELLLDGLKRHPVSIAAPAPGTGDDSGRGPARAGRAKRAGPGQWVRAPSVKERRIEGELFLVNGETDSIYALEGIGGAVWTLLEDPCGTETIVATLGTAFPDVGRETIAADVKRLLRALQDKGIIVRGD